MRTFVIALLAGALATLTGLGTLRLVELPWQPAQLEPADDAGVATERWLVEPGDRVAVTGDGVTPWPAGIDVPDDPRLAGLNVATMKVRNAGGEVIGVASRIVASERDAADRAVWWTFVIGERGTLAAYLPNAVAPGDGRLLGGTRSFEAARGAFAEELLPDGGYRLRVSQVGP